MNAKIKKTTIIEKTIKDMERNGLRRLIYEYNNYRNDYIRLTFYNNGI